ncbi:MAG: DUF1015 family protein [Rhodocyclaceae bacterium]
MHLIRPFRGLRPARGRAAEVIAPPYDVLSRAEACAQAAGKPWSFLHISRPEIDLAQDVDPYSPAVYARAAENLARMLREGVLVRDAQPAFYAYRIVMGSHVQTGLVAAASVAAYESGRIRRHEFTRPAKEDDRVRQIEALDAQTGPVLLACPDAPGLEGLLAEACAGEPDTDVVARDGVRHTLWVIAQPERIERLVAAFDAMPALYIADGHHRSAAAARVAAARRGEAASRDGQESYEYFLSVSFPHRQMRILDYNRVVADLNGLTPARFLEAVARVCTVRACGREERPAARGRFGLYLAGTWYRLDLRPELLAVQDAVERLDVSLLSEHILGPILGIRDLRHDRRIDFVGGIRGLAELERRVDGGEMAAAFAMHPTSMEDLMAVADSGEVMPPKSTWFEPKLADGLVTHVLD